MEEEARALGRGPALPTVPGRQGCCWWPLLTAASPRARWAAHACSWARAVGPAGPSLNLGLDASSPRSFRGLTSSESQFPRLSNGQTEVAAKIQSVWRRVSGRAAYSGTARLRCVYNYSQARAKPYPPARHPRRCSSQGGGHPQMPPRRPGHPAWCGTPQEPAFLLMLVPMYQETPVARAGPWPWERWSRLGRQQRCK